MVELFSIKTALNLYYTYMIARTCMPIKRYFIYVTFLLQLAETQSGLDKREVIGCKSSGIGHFGGVEIIQSLPTPPKPYFSHTQFTTPKNHPLNTIILYIQYYNTTQQHGMYILFDILIISRGFLPLPLVYKKSSFSMIDLSCYIVYYNNVR